MELPAVIDVAIGMVVFYLLLSTVCSFAVEMFAIWFWWRKQLLYETIGRLLTGNARCSVPKKPFLPKWSERGHAAGVIRAFWEHPLMLNLAPDKQIPSYVEASTFSAVVVDIAVPGASKGTLPGTAEGIERVIELASRSGREDLRPLLRQILAAYRQRDLNRLAGQPVPSPMGDLRAGIEKTFNEAMERLGGRYKRKAQRWLLASGLVLAAAFNADTIRSVYVLSTDDALRTAVSTYGATLATATNAPGASAANVTNLLVQTETDVAVLRSSLVHDLKRLQHFQQLGFPLGWRESTDPDLNFVPYDRMALFPRWLVKVAGLIVTAVAISLGAPFWFDLLNKLVSLRGAGKRGTATAPTAPGSAPTSGAGAQAAPGAPPPVLVGPPPSDVGKDLSDGRVDFNVRKGYWSAEAALLAYAARESVRNAVQQWSLDVALSFEKAEAAQGFLAVDKARKIALLAFRGTETKLEDWKTDAAFKPVPSPTGAGRTHEGFTNELEKVYSEIIAELKNQAGADTLLYVVGHSLGGALATLMAARLARDKICGVHAVYTFGSPRVGDREFARAYDAALGHCTFRIVNGEDLVTRVPPRALPGTDYQYDHVGQIIYFDSDGRMQLNAGFWDRFLNTVINAVQDFRNTAKAALKDHSMEGYVRLLRKQL